MPFGISNRSELYCVGLINGPVIKYSQAEGGQLDRSEVGVGYLRSVGAWQVEAALLSHDGLKALTASSGEGTIRLQRCVGPVILGLNGLWGQTRDLQSGTQGAVRFAGLDLRYSRPTLILRGELVAGGVPDGCYQGFYLDLLYHPVSLHRFTLVGRTEAVQGLPGYGHNCARQILRRTIATSGTERPWPSIRHSTPRTCGPAAPAPPFSCGTPGASEAKCSRSALPP
jgi:hypothetical protein